MVCAFSIFIKDMNLQSIKKTLISLLLACVNIMAWGQTEAGLKMLRKAEAGDAKAQFKVYSYLSDGEEGFSKNEAESIKWLKRSAENGYAGAQLILGHLYLHGGSGLPEDKGKAVAWLMKAAEGGDDQAMFFLGLHYERIDNQKAIYWYKKHMDKWYEIYGEEHQTASESLRELGVYYNPSTKTTSSISSTSSSASSSSSIKSTSSSSASSTSSSDDGLLYKGTYTISGQGYCGALGGYTESGEDRVCEIAIYNDYIIVDDMFRYDYTKNAGDWRLYSETLSGMKETYKIDPNFNMYYYSSMSGYTWTYGVKKGKTTFNKYSNNSSNAGYKSSSESTNTNSSNEEYTRTKRTCGLCGGTGRIATTQGVTSFGNTKWCSECNKTVADNHHHETCPSCKGKGEW